MVEQTTLFSHRADPSSSYRAAERAAKSRKWWYQQVYSFLRDHDRPELGYTAKEMASEISEKWGLGWHETYHYIERVLKEMERRNWVFRGKARESFVGGGLCCPWWAVFGKESEVFDG